MLFFFNYSISLETKVSPVMSRFYVVSSFPFSCHELRAPSEATKALPITALS